MPREHVLSVRLTDDEYGFLRERARATGRKLSDVARSYLRTPTASFPPSPGSNTYNSAASRTSIIWFPDRTTT